MTEILDFSAEVQRDIFGSKDNYVRKIEKDLDVAVISRDGVIKVTGDEPNVRKAVGILENLAGLSRAGGEIEDQSVDYAIEMKDEAEPGMLVDFDRDIICHTISGKPIKPKTLGQKKYIDSIRNNLIVFANGPAGTGKTFLAMAMAITAFQNKEVERIIMTRPAIEAGEKLEASLRRAVSDHGSGEFQAEHGERPDRGGASRLYERAHTGQRLHHSRRGAEHDAGADEDVPDQIRLRIPRHHHRRRHTEGPGSQCQIGTGCRHEGP